jgi:4-diphosphocytidyl-2-C-methyl-D-erythritol kinase
VPVPEPSTVVRVRVPAKLNLHLGVGTLRADGYHDLVTVLHAVDLYDEVCARASLGLQLRVRGEGAAGLPLGPDNLAWRAASMLAEHAQTPPDVLLEIDKAIPVAGGMAGGSADAAATLLACATLWRTGTPKTELAELATRLGSDVTFPLRGGTALGTGRGEVLAPVLTTGALHWVLAFANFGISAGDCYRELDRLRDRGEAPGPDGSPDALLDALRAGDPGAVAASLRNDLEAAAVSLAPSLRRTLEAGLGFGALGAIVSGSGPTCAFLCADARGAAVLAAQLSGTNTCHAVRTASGPAHGARLML